jgi:Tol biopolymer transport system component
VVATQACQLARLPAMRTRKPQGDLIAWSSDSRMLAFVKPALNSNWFSGTLQIVTAPEFSTPTTLSSEFLVFGDLTWSPDGARIAYIIFRQPDTYSAAVSALQDAVPLDLFSNSDPRTDSFDSSKVIQSWRTSSVLRILSSCGEDCDQTYEVDLQTGLVSPIGEQLRKAKNRYDPEPNQREYDETIFPVMWQTTWDTRISPQMKRPTWTQDGSKVAYIDRFIYAWVLRVDRKLQYPLNTPFVDVQELKWSPDGRLLALRTDDDVYIYDTECSP